MKIENFETKRAYLHQFIDIRFDAEMKDLTGFDAVFVCYDNQLDAIKRADGFRNESGNDLPSIFTFCDNAEILIDVFNKKRNRAGNAKDKIRSLAERNIFVLNNIDFVAKYVIDLDNKMESQAQAVHDFYCLQNGRNACDYRHLTEFFKQSNRNQVLDRNFKAAIAFGKKYDSLSTTELQSLTPEQMETLSIMEHRRWMIEKYAAGWKYGAQRNDTFKRHNNLVDWKDLTDKEQEFDRDTVKTMINANTKLQ